LTDNHQSIELKENKSDGNSLREVEEKDDRSIIFQPV